MSQEHLGVADGRLLVTFHEDQQINVILAIRKMGYTVQKFPLFPVAIVTGNITPDTEANLRAVEGVDDVGDIFTINPLDA